VVTEQIRKAASVIAVRPAPSGPQILVLERGPSNRFLPGYVVFPGGAVDAEDEALAERWFGDPAEAARAGAIRELAEEAGLGLTASGMIEVSSLEPIDLAPPAADALPEVAHWVAPEQVPVRFDARFFAAIAPGGLVPKPDGGETAAAWWTSAGELVREWEGGSRKLYWPTYFTMMHLAECRTVEDLVDLRFQTREPTDADMVDLPRSVFEQE
jgi:8-oxo-dGTP pyrophosphatase MutT (NUDIX family)